MAEALAHLRVVELCDELPGAYCARQFAAWGADVTVIEPPEGSPLRHSLPAVPGPDGEPLSLLWQYVAAGKRSKTLDLSNPAHLGDVRELARCADAFITDWPPARLNAAGLDCAALSTAAPRLVLLAITPFGADGPYRGYAASDLVLQALSGMLSLSGLAGRAPLKLPANLLPFGCGVSAFIAALAALYERRSSGAGQVVEVACLEAIASLVLFLRAQYLGEPIPRRSGAGTVLLLCADGYLLCSPAVETVWQALLTALGVEPEAVPDALRTFAGRQANLRAAIAFISPHAQRRSARALFTLLGTLQVVCGLLESPAQVLHDEHLAARGYFRSLRHPSLGLLTYPGPAGQMSATPMAPPRPAPELGREPLELGGDDSPSWSTVEKEATSPLSASRQPPLDGLRVLDLTGAWIGPYAAMALADLGAEVIKIEAPHRPDVWRIFRPTGPGRPELPPGANPRAHPRNTSFYYNSVNRNKRGVGLDLAHPEGRQLLLGLVSAADVVMENYTPRVMENFGLGYDELCQMRPDLIMVSFSGYGSTGPCRNFKANGATIETIAGWCSLFGYPDEPPMSFGEMEADPLCGLQMAAQTLVALEHRARTGAGQCIDGSMFEAAAGYIGEELLFASLVGESSHPRGNRDRGMAPQGAFPCAGEDRWIAITIQSDEEWQALLAVAHDAPRLRDNRFASVEGRLAAVAELEALIGEWTRRQDGQALMARLQEAGVRAGVVLRTDEVPRDPHFAARDWFRPLTHPDMGTHLYNGHPWRFSCSELVWRLPAPRLGEHSAAVLSAILGLSEGAYEELMRAGVTGSVLEWPAEQETAGTTT